MSWKLASNIRSIQWIGEKDHQQEFRMPSFGNKQNLDTSEHGERNNILQLPRQLRSFLPSMIHKQNDRRRRAQAFTR